MVADVDSSPDAVDCELTTVILVDDHPLVRRGVEAVLSAEPDFKVVAEASGGEEALELVAVIRPKVVLMDLQMPEMDGLEATRLIKQKFPEVSVVILTVNDGAGFLLEALNAGASGYVLKGAPSELLVQSIRAVSEGAALVPGDMLRRALRGEVNRRPPEQAPPEGFTPREEEVLNLLVRGMGYQEMADHLCLAKVTIKKHVQSIMAKLGVSDRTQAALKAVRMGFGDL